MGTVIIVSLIVFGVVGLSAYKQIRSETRPFFESPRIIFGEERALPPVSVEHKEPIRLFAESERGKHRLPARVTPILPEHRVPVIPMLPEKSA